jgi:hypothetical protein
LLRQAKIFIFQPLVLVVGITSFGGPNHRIEKVR